MSRVSATHNPPASGLLSPNRTGAKRCPAARRFDSTVLAPSSGIGISNEKLARLLLPRARNQRTGCQPFGSQPTSTFWMGRHEGTELFLGRGGEMPPHRRSATAEPGQMFDADSPERAPFGKLTSSICSIKSISRNNSWVKKIALGEFYALTTGGLTSVRRHIQHQPKQPSTGPRRPSIEESRKSWVKGFFRSCVDESHRHVCLRCRDWSQQAPGHAQDSPR